MIRLLYFCFATILIFLGNVHSLNLKEERRNHRHAILSNEQVMKLSKLTDLNNINDVLDNILIPRIVGTEGHRNVRKYIVKQLEDLDWDVERDLFEEVVPILGKLEFENIVAQLNPHAKRYLTFACHYDSKYIPGQIFLGATDSAVPCAMMLNLIKVMKPMLDQIKHKTDISLKLIFFDGEEAFERWGPKDSIYGSKHLAKKWHRTYYPKNNRDQTTELDRMDMMILLDLLGAPDPIFSSYFRSTEKWYMRLVNIEERLSGMRLLERYTTGDPEQVYFKPYSVSSFIEDDHVPFLKRDVPILHVIPNPFPHVWHTPGDNRDIVDLNTVENLNKIFRIFVAEYLHLSI